MGEEQEFSRIRALLRRIDAVTAESQQLRRQLEHIRAGAGAWPSGDGSESLHSRTDPEREARLQNPERCSSGMNR